MKRFLSIAVLAFAVVQASTAQIITSKSITRTDRAGIELKKGYRGFVEIGGSIYVNQPEYFYGLDFSTTHGCQINRWLFVGGGIGVQTFNANEIVYNNLEYYYNKTQWVLPLYADIRTYFTRTAFKPFAELRLGYEIRCSKPATVSWDCYYDEYELYEEKYQKYLKSGLHFGIGAGVEYKRFSLKIMYRLHRCQIAKISLRNHELSESYSHTKNIHLLSFTLGVNF